MTKIRAAFVSVVPSPYQRDLFRALADEPDVALSVFYMEDSAPDSPWPIEPLAPYERLLPGFWLPIGSARVHVNWRLPHADQYDIVVINTLMSITGQRLMRTRHKGRPWAFWGERLGIGGWLHRHLSLPLHRARGIAGIGSWATDDYRRRYPGPQHFNIPYHCNLTAFLRPRCENRQNGTVTFLFCGQMIPRKGLDVLLAAFARLPPAARLLLVGREAELPRMLANLPAEARDRVRYAGFQAPEKLPDYFAQADVFVLASRYDGWGVVINQALGAGLPIICSTQVGAGYDLIEEGVNGLRFEPEDVDKLEHCMRHFLTSPDLISEWGLKSRREAANWSPALGALKWVSALRQMVSTG
jgi:glycosyltransferase involved in cell wall biosynthesis